MSLADVTLQFADSLQKCLSPQSLPKAIDALTALKGETVSAQVLLQVPDTAPRCRVLAEWETPLKEYARLRRVMDVPARLPVHWGSDDNVIGREAGLYPDLLQPYYGEPLFLQHNSVTALWLDVTPPTDMAAGTYPITVRVKTVTEDGSCTVTDEEKSISLTLTVKEAVLPQQTLLCTNWFHSDCLAQYYDVAVFSEEYWRITENFMREAVRTGINLLLTPLFTPPLDTKIGNERLTVQLVQVTQTADGSFSFNFDRLKRWVDTATRAGVRYFEMSHLFTQWGAKACPKIVADTPAGEQRLFGWDVASDSDAYLSFLSQLLPQLTARLREWGIADRCLFHLSDEPSDEALPRYLRLKQAVTPYLEGFRIMDALSHYEFYEQGAVDCPVVAIDAVTPFLQNNVQPLWVYYCCILDKGASNRFIALPSARSRVLGFQMYLANVEGFLQWGFNFYNSAHSLQPINPFLVTDADGAFPAGDPFLVYPGRGGQPWGSVRQMVFAEALQDMRACQLLEQKLGREAVCDLIRQGGVQGFYEYTHSADELLALRANINELL
ncbi:MAG: DUF4091 domain-containing protein [Ruminococcaceae bacterium]|nr:DUF4091 domain-containing protein [Oscillospiraceae bacterium]